MQLFREIVFQKCLRELQKTVINNSNEISSHDDQVFKIILTGGNNSEVNKTFINDADISMNSKGASWYSWVSSWFSEENSLGKIYF